MSLRSIALNCDEFLQKFKNKEFDFVPYGDMTTFNMSSILLYNNSILSLYEHVTAISESALEDSELVTGEIVFISSIIDDIIMTYYLPLNTDIKSKSNFNGYVIDYEKKSIEFGKIDIDDEAKKYNNDNNNDKLYQREEYENIDTMISTIVEYNKKKIRHIMKIFKSANFEEGSTYQLQLPDEIKLFYTVSLQEWKNAIGIGYDKIIKRINDKPNQKEYNGLYFTYNDVYENLSGHEIIKSYNVTNGIDNMLKQNGINYEIFLLGCNSGSAVTINRLECSESKKESSVSEQNQPNVSHDVNDATHKYVNNIVSQDVIISQNTNDQNNIKTIKNNNLSDAEQKDIKLNSNLIDYSHDVQIKENKFDNQITPNSVDFKIISDDNLDYNSDEDLDDSTLDEKLVVDVRRLLNLELSLELTPLEIFFCDNIDF